MRPSTLVLLASLLGAPSLAIAVATSGSAQTQADARVVLHVDGMHCATCPLTVRTVLRRLDGVREASVSAKEKRAWVFYDAKRVTPERMIAAIDDAGYTARIEK